MAREKWNGTYADFVMGTDDVVGQVLNALEENDISNNTLVIFTRDNGCSESKSKVIKIEVDYGYYPNVNFR